MKGVRAGSIFLGAVLAILASGCAVGPNYKRPAIDTPQSFRNDAAAPPAGATTAASFGDEKWFDVFQDPQLQALIHTALERNYDVRIAASRIAQAQAQVMVARSNELPGAAAIVSGTGSRNAQSKFFGAFETSDTELGLGF